MKNTKSEKFSKFSKFSIFSYVNSYICKFGLILLLDYRSLPDFTGLGKCLSQLCITLLCHVCIGVKFLDFYPKVGGGALPNIMLKL